MKHGYYTRADNTTNATRADNTTNATSSANTALTTPAAISSTTLPAAPARTIAAIAAVVAVAAAAAVAVLADAQRVPGAERAAAAVHDERGWHRHDGAAGTAASGGYAAQRGDVEEDVRRGLGEERTGLAGRSVSGIRPASGECCEQHSDGAGGREGKEE